MAWVSKRLQKHKIVRASVWAPLGRRPGLLRVDCDGSGEVFGAWQMWTNWWMERLHTQQRRPPLNPASTTKPFPWRKEKSTRERRREMCQSALLIPRPAVGLCGSRAFHTTSVFVAYAHADLVGYAWTGNRLPGTSIFSPTTHIYIKTPQKCP